MPGVSACERVLPAANWDAGQPVGQNEMAGERFISAREIRTTFIDFLRRTGRTKASYSEFWSVLKADGWDVRGRSPKKQRDYIYNALSGDPRLSRIAPGIFAIDAGLFSASPGNLKGVAERRASGRRTGTGAGSSICGAEIGG